MRKSSPVWIPILLVVFATVAASAQSFRVQCPTSTITHPDPSNAGLNNAEPAYNGPTQFSNLATAGGRRGWPSVDPVPGGSKWFQHPVAGLYKRGQLRNAFTAR